MMGLTQRQAKLMAYLAEQISENGISPSFGEMMEQMGLASTSSISRLLDSLVERNLIRRLPHRARAIEIIGTPAAPLLGPRVGPGLRKPSNVAPSLPSVLKTFSRQDAYLAQRKPHDDT